MPYNLSIFIHLVWNTGFLHFWCMFKHMHDNWGVFLLNESGNNWSNTPILYTSLDFYLITHARQLKEGTSWKWIKVKCNAIQWTLSRVIYYDHSFFFWLRFQISITRHISLVKHNSSSLCDAILIIESLLYSSLLRYRYSKWKMPSDSWCSIDKLF